MSLARKVFILRKTYLRLKNTHQHLIYVTYETNYFQNNLCNLLRVRARLAEKQYSLYKLHANYGRVFSEWSAIEKEMGDGLQVKKITLLILKRVFLLIY